MTPREFVAERYGELYDSYLHREADLVEWGNLLPEVDISDHVVGVIDTQSDERYSTLDWVRDEDGTERLGDSDCDFGIAENVAGYRL
jgi:hypothetical protein